MSRRILVVDDDLLMVMTLCDILRLHGWEATGVHSGADAIQAARDVEYPIVLMDIRMPGMDGVTAFKTIKAEHPRTRVVLMTAHTAPDLIQEAERAGAVRVLSKPVDLPALLKLLD